MDPVEIKLRVKKKGKVRIMDVSGRLTSENDDYFYEQYNSLVDKNIVKILIDFTNVTYINSAGMAVMLVMAKEAKDNGIKMVYTGLTTHFKKVAEMIAMDKLVEITDNRDDAMNSFK